MGNLTLENSQNDQIPDRGVQHLNGVLLGRLAALNPERESSLNLLMDRANMENMPWTVRDGAAAPVSMSIFGQINDANARAPSDRYLGFDPDGTPEWGAFLRHPWDAVKARDLAKEALSLTQ